MTATLKSWEPATGELLGEVPVTSREDVAKTIARAKKAQAAWAVLPIAERSKRLLRFRDALTDVMIGVDQLTYYCNNAAKILAPRELPLHLLRHKRSTLHYVPRGVVG